MCEAVTRLKWWIGVSAVPRSAPAVWVPACGSPRTAAGLRLCTVAGALRNRDKEPVSLMSSIHAQRLHPCYTYRTICQKAAKKKSKWGRSTHPKSENQVRVTSYPLQQECLSSWGHISECRPLLHSGPPWGHPDPLPPSHQPVGRPMVPAVSLWERAPLQCHAHPSDTEKMQIQNKSYFYLLNLSMNSWI